MAKRAGSLVIGFLGVLFGALSTSHIRAAEPPSARLEYTRGAGAETCPTEDELKGTIAARLGYDPFSQTATRVVAVRVSRQGAELRAQLDIRGDAGAGSRTLASPSRDCRELMASLAVAIAIGIDPLSLTRPTAPPPPPLPPPPPSAPEPAPKVVQPEPSPSPPVPPRPSEPIRARASLGVVAGFGAAPSTTAGITAQLGAKWRSFSLAAEGRGDFPVSSATVSGGGSVSASLLVGSLVACLHRGVFAACPIGTLGVMRASGRSVTDPLQDTKFYAATGGRVAVELPLSSVLALRIHGDVLAALTQITLRLNGRDVWTSPPVSGGLGTALVATF